MARSNTLTESDKAIFFRLFHHAYPHSLSRSQRQRIWRIAQQIFEHKITWEEGLDAAGIPAFISAKDIAAYDSAYSLLLIVYFVLFVGGYFGFADSKQQRGPELPPREAREFAQTVRSAASEHEPPEVWIPLKGKPVPVLGPPRKEKPSKPRRASSPKRSQSETDDESKPPPAGRAKFLRKSKNRR